MNELIHWLSTLMGKLLYGSIVAIVVVVGLGGIMIFNAGLSPNSSATGFRYADNGVDCALPANTKVWLGVLVPRVTESTQFLNVSEGRPFLYAHSENITDRVLTTKGVTTQLPPVVEIVFNNYGSATACSDLFAATLNRNLVAQIPLENGEFNLTGATIWLSPYYGG